MGILTTILYVFIGIIAAALVIFIAVKMIKTIIKVALSLAVIGIVLIGVCAVAFLLLEDNPAFQKIKSTATGVADVTGQAVQTLDQLKEAGIKQKEISTVLNNLEEMKNNPEQREKLQESMDSALNELETNMKKQEQKEKDNELNSIK